MSGKLFGVTGKSNRDTDRKSHWGKNEFNSSFPASLLCYMHQKNINPIYLRLNENYESYHDEITVKDLFDINPLANNIYFSFEDVFTPFQDMVKGTLPRSDLVIHNQSNIQNPWVRGFEIKLTAIPDNSTVDLSEDEYSCELVFRPMAIEHLALSIANLYRNRRQGLLDILSPVCANIYNWRRQEEVQPHTSAIIRVLNESFSLALDEQVPFIINPIWKTVGKKSILHDNALDVFVWSNLAFTRLFTDAAANSPPTKMTRQKRCLFWLTRMLFDYASNGVIKTNYTTAEMAYNLQTDKAFSIAGRKTRDYLHCEQLRSPRIQKGEIKNIILENGHSNLSPERRFDAAIINTPGIFDEDERS